VEVEPNLLTALERILPLAVRCWWRSERPVISLPPLPPEKPALPAIERWARKFCLDGSADSWVLRAATRTLQLWHAGNPHDRMFVPSTSYPGPRADPFRFTFEMSYTMTSEPDKRLHVIGGYPWYPPSKKWSEYENEVRQQLDELLEPVLAAYRREQ